MYYILWHADSAPMLKGKLFSPGKESFAEYLTKRSLSSVMRIFATTKYPSCFTSKSQKPPSFVHMLWTNSLDFSCKTNYSVTTERVWCTGQFPNYYYPCHHITAQSILHVRLKFPRIKLINHIEPRPLTCINSCGNCKHSHSLINVASTPYRIDLTH